MNEKLLKKIETGTEELKNYLVQEETDILNLIRTRPDLDISERSKNLQLGYEEYFTLNKMIAKTKNAIVEN